MSREKRFHIRLTGEEFDRLQTEAKRRDVSMAEVMRDFIKTLPPPESSTRVEPLTRS